MYFCFFLYIIRRKSHIQMYLSKSPFCGTGSDIGYYNDFKKIVQVYRRNNH